MQKQVLHWVKISTNLRKNLELWAQTVNHQNENALLELYHPKARVFPTTGPLKIGHEAIAAHLKQTQIEKLTINYRSVSFNPEENLVEGEFDYTLKNQQTGRVNFAFKFDSKNLIVEQASAPIQRKNWKLKNEVSVCTLLTAATVQAILKEAENSEDNLLLRKRFTF